MAGEAILINPRRKHHRRRKNASPRRRRRRYHARSNEPNPRRRRRIRHNARRMRRRHNPRRRHYRRNPALFGMRGGQLMKIAGLATGYVVADIGAGFIAKWIPAEWKLDANIARIGSKALIGIGGPMLLKMVMPRSRQMADALAIGAGISVAVDLFETYIKPSIPGLADYEQIESYEIQPPALSGGAGMYSDDVYTG